MRRELVELLKTPALLSMFSKDGDCASNAQLAIKNLALLDPSIMIPPLLERAYSGFDSVNEVSSLRIFNFRLFLSCHLGVDTSSPGSTGGVDQHCTYPCIRGRMVRWSETHCTPSGADTALHRYQ